MVQIPDYQAAGVAVPSGRMAIPRISGRAPVAEALGDLGQTIGNIAEKKYKQQTDLAVATAKNEYLRHSIDLANKVQEDPDYNSWQKQYDDGAAQARAEIGGKIRDQTARQAFDLDAQTEATRFSVNIAQKSKARFNETKRLGIDQTLEENGKALLGTDDVAAQTSLLQGTNQILDAAAADGTITGDEARAKKKKFVTDFSKDKADSLIPAARLDVLQRGMKTDSKGQVTFEKTGTFADFIPDADRIGMIKVAESERNGQIAAATAGQRQRSESAYKKFADQIITDVTKVDPKAFGRDPDLSGEHGETLKRFYDEQVKKLQGGDGPDENKGPGFWNTFQAVMAPEGDPRRIKDPLEIYKMAGPGKPLTLIGARAAVELLNQRAAGDKRGDFSAQRVARFFATIQKDISEDRIGKKRPGGDDDAFKFYMDKTRQIEDGIAKGKSLDQLLDRDSSDYVGKDWKSYIPPPKVDNYVPPVEVKPRSWFDFLGSVLNSGPAFTTQELDARIKSGDEGRIQGLGALKAAIAAGQISREAAGEYAIKRGWARAAVAPDLVPRVK